MGLADRCTLSCLTGCDKSKSLMSRIDFLSKEFVKAFCNRFSLKFTFMFIPTFAGVLVGCCCLTRTPAARERQEAPRHRRGASLGVLAPSGCASPCELRSAERLRRCRRSTAHRCDPCANASGSWRTRLPDLRVPPRQW